MCSVPCAAQYGYGAELSLGHSLPSNEFFPGRKMQSQLWLHIFKENPETNKNWKHQLPNLRTGFSVAYTDFGNDPVFGQALTVMPHLKFKSFNNDHWNTYLGLGASYFTTEFDPIENPLNFAVSTDITWSFRIQINYQLWKSEQWQWNTGVAYMHHSNGHTSLPNNGWNSFTASLSASFLAPQTINIQEDKIDKKSDYEYISIFNGLGVNVFSDIDYFNRNKKVITIGFEYGKVHNHTFKYGIGAFYRIYEHYYNYLNDNEFLVRDGERFAYLKEDPWNNASNIAVYGKGELLLGHIGLELAVGLNLYKPTFKIDYYINNGWDNVPREIPDFWQFADFDTSYKLKNLINTRIGINYYPLGTDELLKNNFYIGVHMNANFGQADFSEVRLGYIYSFNPS